MRRPLFIARQSGHPRGWLGQVIAAIMVRETAGANRAAIAALAAKPADRVLDIGCGSGLSIELLLQQLPQGHAAGSDPSPVMAARAQARNHRAVVQGRAAITIAPVEHLPFANKAFDAAMSVHTLYFWADLGGAFREIARVLRPGGRLVLVFRTSANAAAASSFPSEVYAVRSLEEVEQALVSEGLVKITAIADGIDGEPALLIAGKPG